MNRPTHNILEHTRSVLGHTEQESGICLRTPLAWMQLKVNGRMAAVRYLKLLCQ